MNITNTIPINPLVGADSFAPQFVGPLPIPLISTAPVPAISGTANPFTLNTHGIDQTILANIGIGNDYSRVISAQFNPIAIDTSQTFPFQLSKNELRSLSFDTILDQPHSINSLFSEEIKELVKNLVEMQKQKLAFNSASQDKPLEISLLNNITETTGAININHNANQTQTNLQINHLLNSSQAEIVQKEQPQERKSSQRAQQSWDEQSDGSYVENKKKEGKSLLKSILSSVGKKLEKLSKTLQEISG